MLAVARGPLHRRADRPHRRRAVGGLDHDLRALAPAQAEQRRRAEHVGGRALEPVRDRGRGLQGRARALRGADHAG